MNENAIGYNASLIGNFDKNCIRAKVEENSKDCSDGSRKKAFNSSYSYSTQTLEYELGNNGKKAPSSVSLGK